VESWNEVSFRLGYRSASNWYATLWVENAFDELYFERGWENADANNQYGYGLFNELVWPNRPQTVGVTFGMEW
jgi:iron complex outermembrane receptor protein